MKMCTDCGETKPLTEFSPNKTCRGGYVHYCKPCKAARDRAYYLSNKERKQKEFAAYYAENRERLVERFRMNNIKRRQNPEWAERQRQKNREYARTHLVKRNEDNKKRRERLANAPVNDFTKEQWEALKQAYQNRCAYCSRDLAKFHTDHVIPIARHGEHSARNIVPSCGPCNTRKGMRSDMPFQVIPILDRQLHDWLVSAH